MIMFEMFFCLGYLVLLGFCVGLGADWLPNPMAYAEHVINLITGKLPKILQPLWVGLGYLVSMVLTVALIFSPMLIVSWSAEYLKTWVTVTLGIVLVVLPASYIIGRSEMNRDKE